MNNNFKKIKIDLYSTVSINNGRESGLVTVRFGIILVVG